MGDFLIYTATTGSNFSPTNLSGCALQSLVGATKICGIYKIESPTGKIYIGQSKNIMNRILYYKSCNCKKQTKLYHSLKKHGWDNHTFEIICQCDELELNNLESYYIKHYQSFNSEYGLNLTTGGDSRVKLSDETKEKLRIAATGNKNCLGKKCAEETREKMSKAQKGKKLSDEHKKKLIGHIVLKETREKISNSLKGNKP